MKTGIWMIVVATAGFVVRTSMGQGPVITSFQLDGQLVWTNQPATGAAYRVMNSAQLNDFPWHTVRTLYPSSASLHSTTVDVGRVVDYFYVEMFTNWPPGMVLIPAGNFVMGNATNVFHPSEGGTDELPQHTVNVSAFYLDKFEVTKALWDEVKSFNGGHGYTYANTGSGKATNHPVNMVNWFDVVKWCNARSQRDGLTPVYYTDAGFTTVYKTNELAPFANWSANGYRLPTEAEWEKAARGGAADMRFPWTDYTNKISWAKENYYGESNNLSYDLSGGSGAFHPTFATGAPPYTSPVGYFSPNGYGLHDMAGNVIEWVWDWYDSDYYASSPGTDPPGPAGPLSYRMARGGAWNDWAYLARVACRNYGVPDSEFNGVGFRCAKGL